MPESRLLIVRDARFRDHVAPPGHPERPARLDAIDRALDGVRECFVDLAPTRSEDDQLLRTHSSRHLDELRALEGRSAQIDPDTYVSQRSLETARLAAGSTADLALRVADGQSRSAFALVRPPGHHAEHSRPMGFCLLNNVAVAVEALRKQAGLERIAIVDWDVHHGNGTQHLYEDERDVLYVSTHQFPFYPGTGALTEQGRDAGLGATVNLPLPAGCGDAEYAAVFESVVCPVLEAFRPELLVVSAGFDAHQDDPLASMRLSHEGFARLAGMLRESSEAAGCRGLLLALEGGYDLNALGGAVAAVIRSLHGRTSITPAPPPSAEAAGRLRALREAHAVRWPSLRAPVLA